MKLAEFAFPGPLRDRLVVAILAGEKTTTSGLLAEYEHYHEELPKVGERELVVDSAERGVAVIETTEVRRLRLSEVDLKHAVDEGEGFETLAQWRTEHEKFWLSEKMRAVLRDRSFTVDDDTIVVAQRFHVVERLS
ncbi:ASCH domain-containing protein [Amycolatopsis sp.]|uniref:ASCH domain-containing protein n=1 Tax=Amycolatopsis sp. TaxID=37632 RepID=UPI002E0600A6|nr:ASCH domain-containing protein [Amycolatopsis sp.]